MAQAKDMTDLIGLSNHMVINDLSKGSQKSYTFLVNPTTYSIKYSADYVEDSSIGDTKPLLKFNRTKNQEMKIDLLFDSTGSLGNIPSIEGKSVLNQIEEFMSATFVENKEQKEKKEIELIWGKMHFKGILSGVSITYSHFDATGDPIRATANCSFSGGDVVFESSKSNIADIEQTTEFVDYSAAKHAINEAMEYGSYIAIIAEQTKATLPKSLRIKEEVAKMIIGK